jgi:hypothetical protein
MKTLLLASLSLALCATATAQTTATASKPPLAPPAATDFAVVQRSGHERVWDRTEYEPTRSGYAPKVHRVVEIGTGICYRDAEGQWQDSRELIESCPGGAAARHGQHTEAMEGNGVNP